MRNRTTFKKTWLKKLWACFFRENGIILHEFFFLVLFTMRWPQKVGFGQSFDYWRPRTTASNTNRSRRNSAWVVSRTNGFSWKINKKFVKLIFLKPHNQIFSWDNLFYQIRSKLFFADHGKDQMVSKKESVFKMKTNSTLRNPNRWNHKFRKSSC